jgi:Bacterial Ig-like domain
MSRLRSIVAQLPIADARSIREIEEEINDELQFHLEMRTEENIQLGLPAAEAREAAVESFGDLRRIRQSCRKALLGERIMLQRLQMVLMVMLLVAVAAIGYQSYQSQAANREANLANQATLAGAVAELRELKEARAQELADIKGQITAQLDQSESVKSGTPPAWAADRPRVVESIPANGSTDVDPATSEIRVTFDKAMSDGSWSWVRVSQDEFPETIGDAHYSENLKTCLLPVKLESGRKYVVWINSTNYQNFKDREGRPAVPYLLTFSTRW